jgi:glycosyltransferase involved in cell wall biosynthesis
LRRVLFVSYYFPPIGGIGTERPLAFARRLPQFGWEPVVLTPSEHTIPMLKAGAGMEIPDGLEVIRIANPDIIFRLKKLAGFNISRNVEDELFGAWMQLDRPRGLKMWTVRAFKNWAYFPDRTIDWYPFLMRAALAQLRSGHFDAIYTSSPPYASAMAGARLQALTGVPWLCDLSDIWTHAFNHMRTGLALQIDKWLERRTLTQARRITVLTKEFADVIGGEYPERSDAITVIPHGYDSDALDAVQSEPEEGFTIIYTGYIAYPYTDPTPLFEAIAALRDAGEDLSRFKFKYVGGCSDTMRRLADEAGVGELVETVPQVPYNKALALMKGADALLYIQFEPGGEKATYSKFAQYIGARKPILALAPTPGEADRMLALTNAGRAARNASDVKVILSEWLAEYRSNGRLSYEVDGETARSFNYTERARLLASELDEIASEHMEEE